LYQVGWFEGKHGPSFDPDEPFGTDTASYVALQSKAARRQFGIVVEDVFREYPKEYRKTRNEYRRLNFGGAWCMIGGDDVWPTTEKIVRRNGLIGREYVYTQEISKGRYTRGRIFYTRGRMYFVIFVATTATDLFSPDADRFLNSFRVRQVRARKFHRTRR
jgi:hypothetical protein